MNFSPLYFECIVFHFVIFFPFFDIIFIFWKGSYFAIYFYTLCISYISSYFFFSILNNLHFEKLIFLYPCLFLHCTSLLLSCICNSHTLFNPITKNLLKAKTWTGIYEAKLKIKWKWRKKNQVMVNSNRGCCLPQDRFWNMYVQVWTGF